MCTGALLQAEARQTLPFSRVFIGQEKFRALVRKAEAEQWAQLPFHERVGAAGLALVGTPYKSYTLEIDDRIEAPSVNLAGLDCWTFFEVALAFARMVDGPRESWTPQRLLYFIELDRYRHGLCDGTYLSRLHYLEEWSYDNGRRGLTQSLTRRLGGVRAQNHSAREMTVSWNNYRYIRNNPSLRTGIARMEERVREIGLVYIPKERVPQIERYLRTGDVISIVSSWAGNVGTSHVGLAYRGEDGVLRFMHASGPRNYNRVVIDRRLSDYLNYFRKHEGIMVDRPLPVVRASAAQ